MLANTTRRVEENTTSRLNERIQNETADRIKYYSKAGHSKIDHRLEQLDHESDIERAIEVEAPLMILAGLFLGTRVHRGFLLISAFASSMVLVHSFQGWYPLLPIFRRLGFRTTREISEERQQLLMLKEQNDAA